MKSTLIVNGAAGRMGRRILSLGIDAGQFEIIAGIERKGHPDIGKDIGLLAGAGAINVKLAAEYPSAADVAIDFSSPDATDACLDYCRDKNVALVIGTTGLSDAQLERIGPEEIADNFPEGHCLLYVPDRVPSLLQGDQITGYDEIAAKYGIQQKTHTKAEED